MASEQERWLGHMEFYLYAQRNKEHALSLSAALSELQQRKRRLVDGRQSDERWTISLVDMTYSETDEAYTLLFLGVDNERADAVYADLQTLKLRSVEKLLTEGGAVSAHLCILAKPQKSSFRHSAVLEEVEGLGRTRIISFLKKVISANCKFEKNMNDGSVESVDGNLEANTVHDVPISRQLRDARLLAVDFVKKGKYSDIDRTLGFWERSRMIQFRPTGTTRGSRTVAIISSILNRPEREEYPEVRIKIEDTFGRQRTVQVDTSKHDALASAFQKRTLIQNLSAPLPEATNAVIEHFSRKMAKAMR